MRSDYVRLHEGGNKKEKHIAVTAAGSTFFEQIRIDTERIEKKVLDALGEENCSLLVASAERLAKLLQDETAKDQNVGGICDGH